MLKDPKKHVHYAGIWLRCCDHVTKEGYDNNKPELFYDTDCFKLRPVLLFCSF